jgi:hypothetical protein
MNNEDKIFDWIPIGEGHPLPDFDEYVLWRLEDGTFFVESIDKDDTAWWLGVKAFMKGDQKKCTHWCKIKEPIS